MKNIKNQFNEITLLKMFEVEVINKSNKEIDYIIFDINIEKDKFIAQHIALNKEEEESKYITYKEIEIDKDFSLDENLEALYDECINAVINSTFYELI